ncbi:DoxX family protein [Paenibacillus thalictri]|nr:DoxX family protein [Paenibacillus thalictri]TBL75143.1 DoxX family protein [Paenibacillus thalictri]
MLKWMRENVYAAGLLLLVRLYVGYEWLTAGFHKLTGGFDATGFLKNAVAKPIADKATGELVYPTLTAFLEHFALPNAKLFNYLIPVGETLVGLGLILGCLTTAAAFFGLLMNFMFMFAGTLNTNPWLALLGGIVILAGTNAARFGVDYYLMPALHNWLDKRHKGGRNNKAGGAAKPAHA